VANVDADAQLNKPLATKYGVNSYPTIKFFPKGGNKDEPLAYDGGRSEADFVRFLNEKCGTHRAVGGGLTDEVSGYS
jgi:protein disulfide-isomerase A6